MAGHGLSAEHAGEAEAAHEEHRQLEIPRRESVSPALAPATRHLYIVHSTDTPIVPFLVRQTAPLMSSTRSRGMLDRSVQAQIGRLLRDAFSDVADEPVPERFVKLLEALEAKEKQL